MVITAAMLITLSLFLGIAISLWQTREALKARNEAETSRVSEMEQRIQAQEETHRANKAEERERSMRKISEEHELKARQRAYAADMLLCQQALEEHNRREALLLLNRQRPSEGEKDLRGWEWRHLWLQCRPDSEYELLKVQTRVVNVIPTQDEKSAVIMEDGGRISIGASTTVRKKPSSRCL